MRNHRWMLCAILLLGALGTSQQRRIAVFLAVSSQNSDAVTAQLGNDLKEEILSSGSYTLASERKQADVMIELIGIGVNSGVNAVASELVCLRPSGPNTAIYHTVSLVGLIRTHVVAHEWFSTTDQQVQHYLGVLK